MKQDGPEMMFVTILNAPVHSKNNDGRFVSNLVNMLVRTARTESNTMILLQIKSNPIKIKLLEVYIFNLFNQHAIHIKVIINKPYLHLTKNAYQSEYVIQLTNLLLLFF